MANWRAYLWVALGSTIGGVGRFWISGLVAGRIKGVFPWNTLVVNVTGSFLIGVLAALADPDGPVSSETRSLIQTLLIIGVCGGYTTFSSFSLQTFKLMHDGEWLYAFGNILGSVLFCLIAVALGFVLGRKFVN